MPKSLPPPASSGKLLQVQPHHQTVHGIHRMGVRRGGRGGEVMTKGPFLAYFGCNITWTGVTQP